MTAPPGVGPVPGFGARLASAVARRESAVVVGLDPEPSRLWPGSDHGDTGSPGHQAGSAVVHHCVAVLDAVAPACVAVKLQSARFEVLGASGHLALEAVLAHARSLDLLVLLDGKRGDIDVSAAAYAAALLGGTSTPWGDVPGLGADAVTVAPYMGTDSLRPFVDAARPRGAGVFALVRTSNPGGADLQDRELAEGGTVWERVAAIVSDVGGDGGDPVPGPDGHPIADVGAVVGATAPDVLARVRELLPRAPLLLPGVGAQGGRVEDLAAAFAPGPGAGLVTASRSIVDATGDGGGVGPAAARRAAEALRDAVQRLP